MESTDSMRAGHEWLLDTALELGGDLARILELDPPIGVDEEWRRGFYFCRLDLIDLLYPDGETRTLGVYLKEHRADDADAASVELLADPECDLTITEIREVVARERGRDAGDSEAAGPSPAEAPA